MTAEMLSELQRFGATPDQLVDLQKPGPRTLRFADLMRVPEADRAPVVVESQGRPLVYVYDGRADVPPKSIRQWVRRIAFRGDADWLGILRPGRLDIYPAVLDEKAAAVPSTDLPEGTFRIPALVYRPGVEVPSVRSRLRSLLFASIKTARDDFRLSERDALALVGGAVFWRFLVDRGLLEGLEPSSISPTARNWTECFDTKSSALATIDWLETTFNGGLVEFESPKQDLPEGVYAKVAGDIAHKTDSQGQLSLPEKWAEIDFAHVPVGLLSEVYEAISHDRDKRTATEKGLFYTPRHLAEYIIDEVLDALHGVQNPHVLDPAAGAGVFLVAAFRALVAREWIRSCVRPSRARVRHILNEQLVGFDIDTDALRLAELALYLTAIELDPEAKPRPLEVLKFASLRGKVLVEQTNGDQLGSLGPVQAAHKRRFDAVIGNPPWTALRKGYGQSGSRQPARVKKAWADASRSVVSDRLGKQRAAEFEFPDANPDLPFVYRAMEWAKPGGVIGLLTHARWLFSQSQPGVRARRDLLESVHVTGVLNAAALRLTKVWPNVAAPFCILFSVNEAPPRSAAFQFVSPELDTADPSQDRIRIDWRDAAVVEVQDVIRRPWSLKTLFRGTSIDEAVVQDIADRGTPLGQYLDDLGTYAANGYQATATREAKPTPSEMKGLPDLRHAELDFSVDTETLGLLSHERLHRSRDPSIYRAPLLIVHESMVVDRWRPRSGLALRDVAYDERFDGVSFAKVPEGERIAGYFQVVLQSSVFTHALLMLDSQFGVEREVVHLDTIKRIPVIPWEALTSAQRKWAVNLSNRLRQPLGEGLLDEVDTFVARLYRLTAVQQQAIRDTLATSLPTKEARETSLRKPTSAERAEFARVCERSLQDIVSASSADAYVRRREDLPHGVWRFLQVDRVPTGSDSPAFVDLPVKGLLEAAEEGAASLVTLHLDGATTLVALLDRYHYWTPTRARLLASTLLAEAPT